MDIKHYQKPSKVAFLDELQIKNELKGMVKDKQFDTNPIKVRIDDSIHEITFYKKHMKYLKTHPNTNPALYLANLKTMTRIRHL